MKVSIYVGRIVFVFLVLNIIYNHSIIYNTRTFVRLVYLIVSRL